MLHVCHDFFITVFRSVSCICLSMHVSKNKTTFVVFFSPAFALRFFVYKLRNILIEHISHIRALIFVHMATVYFPTLSGVTQHTV